MTEEQGTAPAAGPAATAVTPMAGAGQGDFTPEQIQQLAAWAVEDGQLTREQANAMLAADGGEPLIDAPPIGSVAAEIDAAFPPAKPMEFEIPSFAPDDAPLTPEMIEFDGRARGWLSTAGFTAGIGSAIAKEIAQVADAWEKMNPTERELWDRGEQAKLDGMWGDQKPAKMELARQLIRELEAKSPGVVELLETTGAGNSAMVAAQLALHAERLAAKRAK